MHLHSPTCHDGIDSNRHLEIQTLVQHKRCRLVDFQTKRVGVPFDGCSRLVRSAQCQIQRPFGRLKLGNPSSALEWMFFPLLRPQMICSLVEQLVRGRGRGMCVPGRSRAGGRTGCSCRASTSARLTNMPRKLAGRVASSPGNSPPVLFALLYQCILCLHCTFLNGGPEERF